MKRKTADLLALLWFSSRLNLGLQAYVLLAIAVGIFAYCAFGQRASELPDLFRLVLGIETVLFVMLSMGLLPREKEARTLELLLVCARSRHQILFQKFLPVCLFVALVALILTSGFYLLRGGFSWVKMAWVPYLLAATIGILTVVITTYLRNQYAAGVVALLAAVVVTTLWLDPLRFFYGFEAGPAFRGSSPPNLLYNRILLAIAFGLLYDHAVRRLKRVELWMK